MREQENLSPILVTGAHRAGTTWVGKTLAMAPGVAYIHEPFNLKHRPGVCNIPINKWYTYISEQNSKQFYDPIEKMLEFRYDIGAELGALKSFYDFGRMMRDIVKISYLRLFRPKPLVKDPFALFSAEWYSRVFNTKVVIVVRHPAAYVSSIMKKNWYFPFEHWSTQSFLLHDLLTPFADEIREYACGSHSLLDQAVLLWKTTHYVVDKFRAMYPSWLVVRHEDLCRDSVHMYKSVFKTLRLTWTSKVDQFVADTTNSGNPVSSEDPSVFNVRRDSESTINVWKKRLDREQIHYIRKETEIISDYFYDDVDWN
jgi:hypothetical protein